MDMGPRKVEWPVLVVNPDNEIECGQKLYDDKSAPSKEDPSNYFESEPVFKNVLPDVNAPILIVYLLQAMLQNMSAQYMPETESVLCDAHPA